MVLPQPARPEQREQLALRHVERDVLRGLHDGAVFARIFGEDRRDLEHVVPDVDF